MNNRIDDGGSQALAEGLRLNTTLRVLCMHYNVIGDEGCQALACALKSNSSLLEFSMKHNNITSLWCGSNLTEDESASECYDQGDSPRY
jgi:Ran GTPase-activating protein (RanGAP) involved in mRNA processing and transport